MTDLISEWTIPLSSLISLMISHNIHILSCKLIVIWHEAKALKIVNLNLNLNWV